MKTASLFLSVMAASLGHHHPLCSHHNPAWILHRHQSLQREQMLDLLVDVFFLRFGDDHPDSDGKSNELPTTDASGAGDNELEEEAQLQQHGSFDDTHEVGGAVEDDSDDAVMFGQLR